MTLASVVSSPSGISNFLMQLFFLLLAVSKLRKYFLYSFHRVHTKYHENRFLNLLQYNHILFRTPFYKFLNFQGTAVGASATFFSHFLNLSSIFLFLFFSYVRFYFAVSKSFLSNSYI